MKMIILGGYGQKGRAALYDLSCNPSVDHVSCADIQPDLIHSFDFLEAEKKKGFLSNLPVKGLPCEVSHSEMAAKLL